GSAESNTTTVPAGGMSYKAHYNGSTTYAAADGPCEPLNATTLTPTVATDILDTNNSVITSSPIGSTVHDRATVTGSQGTPTGTVDFLLYANSSCTAPATTQSGVTLSGGIGTSNTTTVPSGGMSYKAHYNGSTTYSVADGPCEP